MSFFDMPRDYNTPRPHGATTRPLTTRDHSRSLYCSTICAHATTRGFPTRQLHRQPHHPKAYKTEADDVRYSVDFDDGDKISAMPSPLVRAMAPTKKDSFLLKVGDQAVCCPKQSVRTKK